MLLKTSRNLSTRTNESSVMQIRNNQSMTKKTLTNSLPETSPSHGKRGSREDKEGHWKIVRFAQNPLTQHR
jgi:hypothetical protein